MSSPLLDRNWDRRTFLRAAGAIGAVSAVSAVTAACGSSSSSAIQQWYHQYGEKGVEQAVKRYAGSYKKTKINVQWTPGDYDTKLSASLLSKAAPDIFEGTADLTSVRAHQVTPLDDLIAKVRADFTPAILKSHTVEGKLYGIPQAIDMQMLFYRKSWFERANLAPPSTVDELIHAAKVLTTGQRKGFFAGNDSGVTVLAPVSLWSVGLDYLSSDGATAGFDDPQAVTAFGKLRELYSSGALLAGAPTDWSDPSAFIQGLTAMQWTGLWAVPQIQDALHDDFDVLPWPKLTSGGSASVPIGAFGSQVSAKSKHLDAAKQFVQWLWVDRTDYQQDFNLSYGLHIPPRKSIAAKAKRLQTGAAAKAVNYVQTIGRTGGGPTWTAPMSTALTDALSNIVRKGNNPSSELKTAVTTINSALRRQRQ